MKKKENFAHFCHDSVSPFNEYPCMYQKTITAHSGSKTKTKENHKTLQVTRFFNCLALN